MNLFGNPLDFIIAFFGGVLASFTPCVYPLIPVGVGYVTAGAAGSRKKGFLLSFAYVSGMALAYSALGILAVLTGTFFGKFSSSPLVHLVVGIIIIFCGLSVLGVFQFRFPLIKIPQLKGGAYLTVFLLGLVSGFAISPCLTPILGTILAFLMTKKNLLYGWLLLMSFSYGLGLIFVIAGTFSSFIVNLPKLGKWMVYIKNMAGSLIILSGIYFIWTAMRRF